jgi:chromate transporter
MTVRMQSEAAAGAGKTASASEVFWIFLRLGCTSFGGPVAHLGYFRAAFVARRQWLDEPTYADIVALCQFLPGPASSQVAFSLGILRAGLPGGLAAWLGFTLPSATALILFADGIGHMGAAARGSAAWLHGLMIVAVAVVAQAVYGMARTLCPDRPRATLMVAAAAIMLVMPGALSQIGVLILGAVIGAVAMRQRSAAVPGRLTFGLHRMLAVTSLVIFVVLLFLLPLAAAASHSHALDLVARFYRAGALVFGGGHVVLPLLQQAVVPPGWIGDGRFLAGYGAAQAVPGPLFTFAAYLGAAMGPRPNGGVGGVLCLIAIYMPSLLLLIGVLPFWDGLRRRAGVQAVLRGVNAAVVGVLLAALYTPVWTSAIRGPADVAIAFAAFLLLVIWRMPAWAVVILGAATAAIIA